MTNLISNDCGGWFDPPLLDTIYIISLEDVCMSREVINNQVKSIRTRSIHFLMLIHQERQITLLMIGHIDIISKHY